MNRIHRILTVLTCLAAVALIAAACADDHSDERLCKSYCLRRHECDLIGAESADVLQKCLNACEMVGTQGSGLTTSRALLACVSAADCPAFLTCVLKTLPADGDASEDEGEAGDVETDSGGEGEGTGEGE